MLILEKVISRVLLFRFSQNADAMARLSLTLWLIALNVLLLFVLFAPRLESFQLNAALSRRSVFSQDKIHLVFSQSHSLQRITKAPD